MVISPPLLQASALKKNYGKRVVLHGVTHEFPVGLTLLTGSSGAGKSTLLRLLATAEKATQGELRWKGEATSMSLRALRTVLGYSPQAVDLPEDLTAREFGAYMSALKGIRTRDSDEQFSSIVEVLGMVGDIDSKIGTFSGGMRRRLILAQALLGRPELLVLDEPTAELDTETAHKAIMLLRSYMEQAVIVVTTHADAEFRPYAVEQVRIDAGRLEAI